MPISKFPDPRLAGEEGLVAVGGDLHPKSLLLAYRNGIFPWPIEGFPLTWFSPQERAVLFFKDLRLPKRLKRFLKNHPYRVSFDRCFDQVIRNCASAPRPENNGTWITKELEQAYNEFHRQGFAHSVEVWEEENLVGGLYGVLVEGVFSGESMFHCKPNASRLALMSLIELLSSQSMEWIDIQQLTPHMESMGAIAIDREDFLQMLHQEQAKKKFYSFPE